MGHLQQIEAEFRERLAKNDVESLVSWVKERILASYRNGQAARGRATAESTSAPVAKVE